MTFNDLGVQKVKQNEFHAFDILLDPSQKRTLKTKSSSMMPIIGAVAAVLVVLFSGLLYLNISSESDQQVTTLETSSKPILLIMPMKTPA